MSDKSPIEKWINNHREIILLAIILPLGKILSTGDKIVKRIVRPKPADHNKRVQRVIKDVQQAAKTGKPLRTNRHGSRSLTTRMSDKSRATCIKMNDLRGIVSIDREKMTIRVEPFATIGEVVSYLDKKGFQLETAIEMKDATMGGLVLAVGMTTHSHISGLMHDTVEAYEIVTAEGELIRAERDGDHADLFRALPWSHGTLGLLVALELRIVSAPPYIRMVYHPVYSLNDFCKEHSRRLFSDNPPPYLEGQIFRKDRAVIIEGYPASAQEVKTLPINHINRWYKPFFFKHVESMLDLGPGKEYCELIPLTSYLMRHNRSMCMTMGQIIPTANQAWFRYLFGWTLPPNMKLLKSSRPREERERSMKQQVYQDFAFPAEHLQEILDHLDSEFEIYPLLVYPCRVIDQGGMVRLPGQHGMNWDGKSRSKLFFNLGIYGIPKAVRRGNLEYPTVKHVRKVEQMIREWGGFLHTYVDIFSTAEEFEKMFDHSLWIQMRQKYKAEGVFPRIYDKVKPELNPLDFL